MGVLRYRLPVSSPVTAQGGRTEIYGQIAPVFPEYIAPAPAVSYATPLPTAFAAPALVVERISPDFTVYASPMKYVAAPAPVVEYVVYAAKASVEEFHRSSASGKLLRGAYSVCCTSSSGGTHFSSSCGVCRNRPCGRVSCTTPAPTVFPLTALVGECFSPAPEVSYAAASAPEVTPAPDVAYRAHVAPDPEVEYIASAAAGYAGPAPDTEKYFISMTRLEGVNCAALMIQRGWRWSRERIVLRAASEERLQEKLREVWRRLVACLPVGASARKKTETLKKMQSTLKAVEKEWRMLFTRSWVSPGCQDTNVGIGVEAHWNDW